MYKAAIWSGMIFLILNFGSATRAAQPPLNTAKYALAADARNPVTVSVAANVQPILTSAGSYPATADYDWMWNRVAAIPEPASVVLLMIGGVLMFGGFRKEA